MFDRIVVVDWSAAATPRRGRDSIWIASRAGSTVEVVNPATRADALAHLTGGLDERGLATTLLTVDFSLGYPAGSAAAMGVSGVAWAGTWAMLESSIEDDAANANNRFEVAAALNRRGTGRAAPFWGCPPSRRAPTLSSTKPTELGLPEWRLVEERLRATGRRPFSAWQLLGAGAVGGQTLVGIPRLSMLRKRYGRHLSVWPFDTGLTSPTIVPGAIVVAEVWPSLFEIGADEPRDRAQVIAAADALYQAQLDGSLASWFAPHVDPVHVEQVVGEEGWVLGVR